VASAQKLHCQVEQIVNHGEHVYTIVLRPERLAPRFQPGQFLHLAMDEYDPSSFWPESRVFSIASPPAERERLRISYSVRGRFTARMERELAEGRWVWVKLPYGEFVIQNTRDVVLFAGGTGITAFTAYIANLSMPLEHEIHLFYGARREDLLIYRELSECVARDIPKFHPCYSVEEAIGGRSVKANAMVGRPSAALAWPMLRDPFETDYYISGPPAMLKSISEDLGARQVDSASIKIDAWE
jgi:NAD(P)H-flavin reductase